MQEYKEVVDTVEVPKNTGIDGFVHTLKEILRYPRLQSIQVDAKGKVTYRRYILNGEQKVLGINFEHLEPAGIIRNTLVEEVMPPPSAGAAVVIGMLFDRASRDHLHPVAFSSGAATSLWWWYEWSTGVVLASRDRLFGLPFYTDRMIPDSALILCAAYSKEATLVDTQKAYKVEMDVRITPPETSVEVF